MKIIKLFITAISLAVVLFLYFYFTKAITATRQIQAALQEAIADLKKEHAGQLANIGDDLDALAADINHMQSDEQKRVRVLKNDLASLQNTIADSHSSLSRKYNALHVQWQSKNRPIISIIHVTPAPAVVPIPTAVSSPEPTRKTTPDPEDAKLSALFAAGRQAFEKKEYGAAKEAFGYLLATNPPLWEAHLCYIQAAYYENPGKAAADGTVKELLDNLPVEYNIGLAAKFKGLLALEKGACHEAVEALTRYCAYRKEAESLLALGQGYLALKKQDEADAVFNELCAAFPESREAGIAAKYITGKGN